MAKRRNSKSSLARAQRCLSFALSRAMRNVTRTYDAHLRTTGLRSTQFNTLVVLDATGPITISALAERMALERTTLTRNLSLLAERGWIRVEPGEDRRARRVSLTTAGRRTAVAALPAWSRGHAEMVRFLGQQVADEIVDRLNSIVAQN